MAQFNADILLQVQSGGADRQIRKLERGVNRIEQASRDILSVDKQILGEKRRLIGLEGEAARISRRRVADLRLQRQEIALQKREMQGLISTERKRSNSLPKSVGAGLALSNIPGQSIFQAGAAGALVGGPKGAAVAGLVALGVEAGKAANRAAILNAEVNRYRIALAGVAGDQRAYNELLQGAAEISQRYATPLGDTIKNLTQLRAATASAGFSAKETVDIYEDLSQANIALGGNAEQLSGILRATTQVFSKGKVQAEELRGQIGDRLAGAFGDFAEASGKSTAELDKNLKDGEVSLADFLKFAEFVGRKYGDSADKMAKSGENAGARLTKAIENLQLAAGPLLTDVGANFQDLGTQIIEWITPAIEVVGKLVTKLREMELAQINTRIQTLQQALQQDPNSQRNQQSLANLIGRRDQITGALQPPVAKTQPKKQKQTLENVLSPEEQDRLIKRAAQNLEAAKDLTTELERRVLLSEMTNDLDRDALQLGLDLEDRMAEIAKLEDQRFRGQQAILAQRIHDVELSNLLTKAEKDKTEELNKQLEAWKELDNIRSTAFNGYAGEQVQQLTQTTEAAKATTSAFDAMTSSVGNSVQGVVAGTQTIQEAVSAMFAAIGKALIDYAVQALQTYYALAIARIAAGVTSVSSASYTGNEMGGIFNNPSFGVDSTGLAGPLKPFAEGGYVTGPTPALIGEGGEPEYAIPASKMPAAMANYKAGKRGSAVLNGDSKGESTPIYSPTIQATVMSDGQQWVTVEQMNSAVQEGMAVAAKQGAAGGYAKTMGSLKNSISARKKLGMG